MCENLDTICGSLGKKKKKKKLKVRGGKERGYFRLLKDLVGVEMCG